MDSEPPDAESADDANDDVPKDAEASAAHRHTSEPARDQTNDEIRQDTHDKASDNVRPQDRDRCANL